MEDAIPARLSPAEGRRFGLAVGLGFLALGGLLAWRSVGRVSTGLAIVGGLLLLAGLTVPSRLGPVYRGWMAAGRALSKVTTPVAMAIIYWGVLTPTGLIRRAIRRGPDRGSAVGGLWHERPSGARQSDLHRQF